MSMNGLVSSFVAAVQASLSVLLVISYGGIAAKLGLLNSSNGKAISKICVKMFLPALLLVQIGTELHIGSAHRYLVILIGIFAHLVFGLPDWVTAAIMFNNTTSYPLLLIQSLDETGILGNLIVGDDTTRAMIGRAKSYFLVFATVSSCLTFAVGPRLIDTEHAPDPDEDKTFDEQEEDVPTINDSNLENGRSNWPPTEQTGLLAPQRQRHESVVGITFFPSKPKFTTVKRRPIYIPHPHWADLSPRVQWWLLFLYDFLNAPLVGAVLGVIIGLTPPLHRAFFNNTYDGGIFTAWLTESWKNIGSLFVPLPLIVAGISLYTSWQDARSSSSTSSDSSIPKATTAFILAIRFILWPVLSIGSIYLITSKTGIGGFLSDDPMLWFTMMLMPTGPPAMKLITMVQVSDAGVEDERRIAGILTISYIVSPIMAFIVVGAMRASQAVI
jgi:predicted permease